MDDDLIPIGQFAALTWLSPKALRLYHEQGLLEPQRVDPSSGYRCYAPDQIPTASRISLLRRAGVSLADIARFLDEPTADQITQWQRAISTEAGERHRLLDHVLRLTPPQEPTMPDPSSARLDRAIPVLASLDLERTQRFYADRLGFEPLFSYPDYAISGRDDVQVHFWLTEDADIPKATSCRITVRGIDELYAEMQANDVVHPNGALTEQPWGLQEFSVLDGDGNLITFGQPAG